MKKWRLNLLLVLCAAWSAVILYAVINDRQDNTILGVLQVPWQSKLWGGFDGFPFQIVFAFLFPPVFILLASGLTARLLHSALYAPAMFAASLESVILSAALGFICIGYLTLAAGWIIGYLGAPFFWIVSLTGLSLGCMHYRICSFRRFQLFEPAMITGIFLRFCAVALLPLLIYCASPPIQSDGMRYHLAAPQEWLKAGRIEYLPLNAFSNFPFLGEMLYLFCMIALPEISTKLLHTLCFIGTCAALGLLGRRICASRQAHNHLGLLAPFIWLTTPVAYILAGWEFIDHFTTLFFTLTLYCLARHKEPDWVPGSAANSAEPQNRIWLILAGIFGGAALATKYTMLPLLFALCVYLIISRSFQCGPAAHFARAGKGLRDALLFGGLLAALFAPWLIKNWQFTGNPVYPLANSYFHGGEWTEENQQLLTAKGSSKGAHQAYAAAWNNGHYFAMIQLLLRSPFDASIHYKKYEAQFPGLIYVCALPLLLLLWPALRRRNFTGGLTRLLLPLLIFYWLLWFHTYQSNRFLLPALPLMCWLILIALIELREFTQNLMVSAALFIVALGAFQLYWCLSYLFVWGAPAGAMPAALGFIGKDRYLSQLNYYPMTKVLPRYVKAGERVLFIGEHRGYYFAQVDYCASDWFDTPAILWYIRQTKNNDELFGRLLQDKIHYVMFNDVELIQYYSSDFVPRFTPEELQRFQDFTHSKRLRRIAQTQPAIYLCRIE